MTKKFEEYRWVALGAVQADAVPELGEYAAVLVPGKSAIETSDLDKEIALRLASDKEWSKEVARRFDVASSDVYNALQKMKSK